MNFEVILEPRAEKFLDKLEKEIAIRILDKFEEMKEDPFRYLEHYEGKGYKLRIGDYRALIDVDFNQKVLLIMVIDKRGKIYK